MLDAQVRRSIDKLTDRDLVDALVRRGWEQVDPCAWWEAEYGETRRVLIAPADASQKRGPT